MVSIKKWNNDINKCQKHNHWLPSPSMRSIIVDGNRCGKTNLLLNLLLQDNWLDYDKKNVCRKSLHQTEYQQLISSIEKGFNKQEIKTLFQKGSGDTIDSIQSLPEKRGNPLSIL